MPEAASATLPLAKYKLVFLGDQTKPEVLNTSLWRGGSGVLPARITSPIGRDRYSGERVGKRGYDDEVCGASLVVGDLVLAGLGSGTTPPGLDAIEAPHAFVTACDVPFLAAPLVEQLFDERLGRRVLREALEA